MEAYIFNKHLVEDLARRFGFSALFYWQPVVYEKASKSLFERRVNDETEAIYPGSRRLYVLAYQQMREKSAKAHIIDLDRVFSDMRESYYTDECHIIEPGNRTIVDAMLPSVIATLRGRTSGQHRIQSPPPSPGPH